MRNISQPIDWHYWRNMREVELWQACLLSLQIDPDSLERDPDGWMAGPQAAPYFTYTSFATDNARENYRKRLDLLRSNLYVRDHFTGGKINTHKPNCSGVKLAEFAAWAIHIGLSIPPELEAFAESPIASKSQTVLSDEKALSTAERNTLLKLVIGMAVKGYGYDPESAKSTAPREIAEDLEKLGIPVSDDTVRKYLKQAASVALPARGCGE